MIAMAGGPTGSGPTSRRTRCRRSIRLVESMGIRKHKCRHDRRGRDGRRLGRDRRPDRLPDRRPQPGPVRPLVEAYPGDDLPGDRRSSRLRPELVRRDGAIDAADICPPSSTSRSAWAGPGSPRDDAAAFALRARRLAAQPRSRRPPRLRRPRPRLRPPADRRKVRRARGSRRSTPVPRTAARGRGLPVPRLVLGGTPTFPIHAEDRTPGVECSPGTCVLHDAGYSAKFPDLPFTPAAVLLTRVVSQPRAGRVCLDLGHKAVAADPVGRPVHPPRPPRVDPRRPERGAPGGRLARSPTASSPGSPLLAIPTHICPTCALHSWAYVIDGGEVVDRWEVRARDRVLGL